MTLKPSNVLVSDGINAFRLCDVVTCWIKDSAFVRNFVHYLKVTLTTALARPKIMA